MSDRAEVGRVRKHRFWHPLTVIFREKVPYDYCARCDRTWRCPPLTTAEIDMEKYGRLT